MESTQAASQTAMLIASLRALSCYEEDSRIRGNDTLAEIFLPDDKRASLRDSAVHSGIRQMIPAGLYAYVIARTAWFDQLLLHHLEKGTRQVVILGAGFDSRAVRFSTMLENSNVYELDRAATQDAKLCIYQQNHIAIPENVHIIPVDFEQNTWVSSLTDAGFQRKIDSLFIWEGVTFYLSPQAVSGTLSQIAECMSDGSALSFDYQHMEENRDLIDSKITEERIRFGMNHRMIYSYLRSFGLNLVEDVNSEKLTQRFLINESGQVFDTIQPMMHIALTSKNRRR